MWHGSETKKCSWKSFHCLQRNVLCSSQEGIIVIIWCVIWDTDRPCCMKICPNSHHSKQDAVQYQNCGNQDEEDPLTTSLFRQHHSVNAVHPKNSELLLMMKIIACFLFIIDGLYMHARQLASVIWWAYIIDKSYCPSMTMDSGSPQLLVMLAKR